MTDELKAYSEQILGAINVARDYHDLPRVIPGSNAGAQVHADDLCANACTSHWGSDGITPAVRYTLYGGANYSQQWVTGQNYRSSEQTSRASNPTSKISSALRPLVEPASGNSMALNPRFDSVNIGVAESGSDIWIVLQFATDEIEFEVPPHIEAGYLIFQAKTTDYAAFSPRWQLARVNYLPMPHRLTRAQLVLSSGNDQGRPIMTIMKPDAHRKRYKEGSYVAEQSVGVNPYDIDPNIELPESRQEITELAKQLRDRAVSTKEVWKVPQRNASVRLTDNDETLHASVWFGDALDAFGNGIYSVTVWGTAGSEKMVPLCNYAVFVPPRELATV